MSKRYVVIMAGAKANAFGQIATPPAPAVAIVGNKAMLAQTIDRLADLVPAEDVFIITNTEQRDAVLKVCPELTLIKSSVNPSGAMPPPPPA